MGSGDYVATSAHMLWIGDRTRQPDGAHVEFCRGIVNPIGLKCGPSLEPDELLRLIDILNPKDEAGPADADLPLRRRQGREASAGADPRGAEGRPHGGVVVRSHARQHGDGRRPATRRGPSRASSARWSSFFAIHRAEGTYPGGVHIEMTGQNVTECTGGATKISEADLARQYDTGCDPRLNAGQSLELAFLLAERLKQDQADGASAASARRSKRSRHLRRCAKGHRAHARSMCSCQARRWPQSVDPGPAGQRIRRHAAITVQRPSARSSRCRDARRGQAERTSRPVEMIGEA